MEPWLLNVLKLKLPLETIFMIWYTKSCMEVSFYLWKCINTFIFTTRSSLCCNGEATLDPVIQQLDKNIFYVRYSYIYIYLQFSFQFSTFKHLQWEDGKIRLNKYTFTSKMFFRSFWLYRILFLALYLYLTSEYVYLQREIFVCCPFSRIFHSYNNNKILD